MGRLPGSDPRRLRSSQGRRPRVGLTKNPRLAEIARQESTRPPRAVWYRARPRDRRTKHPDRARRHPCRLTSVRLRVKRKPARGEPRRATTPSRMPLRPRSARTTPWKVPRAMLRLAVAIPLAGALGLWLGYEVCRGLWTGVAHEGNNRISFRTRPWRFSLAIAVQAGFAATCAVVLLRLLREALVKSA